MKIEEIVSVVSDFARAWNTIKPLFRAMEQSQQELVAYRDKIKPMETDLWRSFHDLHGDTDNFWVVGVQDAIKETLVQQGTVDFLVRIGALERRLRDVQGRIIQDLRFGPMLRDKAKRDAWIGIDEG